MDAVFVDWDVEFAEIEGAPSPVDVVAPVVDVGEVVPRVVVVGAHQTPEKMRGVAVHPL